MHKLVCVKDSTLAVELALVKSLELRRGCTFGGAAMVGLSTCGVVLKQKEMSSEAIIKAASCL